MDVRRLAGTPEWYPNADDLIDLCAYGVLLGQPRAAAFRVVRDVFAGLTKADVRGLISVGDEHEWAYLSVRANERAAGQGLS